MPAKFNLLVAASIPAVAIVPLLACGGGGGGKADAPVIVTHDSAGSGGSGSASCLWPSTYNPTVTASGTRYIPAGSGTNVSVENRLDFDGLIGGTANGSDEQIIRVLIYGGCGINGTGCTGGVAGKNDDPDWPTVFTAKQGLDLGATVGSGSNLALAHPDIALLLLGDPGTTSFNTAYIAIGGIVNVDMASNGSGHTFAGSGSNLDFLHYDFATNDFSTDNCESVIPHFAWTGSAQFDGKVFYAKDLSPETMNYLRQRHL